MTFSGFPEFLSASPTNSVTINLSNSPTIDLRYVPIKICGIEDDKIPKRLGGKDMSMKDINKLRYGRF